MVGVVGATRLDPAPLIGVVRRCRRAHQGVERRHRGLLVGANRLVADVSFVVPVELPAAELVAGERRRRHRPAAARASVGRAGSGSHEQAQRGQTTSRLSGRRAAVVVLHPVGWTGDELDNRHAAAGRPVRSHGDRPARVPHRPLQPALFLLHAGRGTRLAARRRHPHRRRGRPPHRHRRHASRGRRGAVHRRRAADPSRLRRHRPAYGGRSTRARASSVTTNGIGLDAPRRRSPQAGLDRVNVSLDTIRPDTFRDDHPARPLRRRRPRARGGRRQPAWRR